jgi:uncharacterized protein involved in exopolysaccharide biosynthesis
LNLNPTRKVVTVNSEISARDKMLLATMYGEVVRNLGMAKMTLVEETPIIQVIDRPILPLRKVRTSRIISCGIGAFLFIFLASIFLLVKRSLNATIKDRALQEAI